MGVSEIKARIEQLREQLKTEGRQAFKDGTAALFEKWGDKLQNFSWTQYTPYFNDGDTCEFSAHTDYIFLNVPYEKTEYYDGPYYSYDGDGDLWDYEVSKPYRNEDVTEEQEIATDIIELLGSLGDEILKDLFGDHARVVVTRDGATAQEYDHD